MNIALDKIQDNFQDNIELFCLKVYEKASESQHNKILKIKKKRLVEPQSEIIKSKKNNDSLNPVKNVKTARPMSLINPQIINRIQENMEKDQNQKISMIKNKYSKQLKESHYQINSLRQKYDKEREDLCDKYKQIISSDIVYKPKFQKIKITKKQENIFEFTQQDKSLMNLPQGKKHQEIFYDVSKSLQAKNLVSKMNTQRKMVQEKIQKKRDKSYNNIKEFVDQIQQRNDINKQISRQKKIDSFHQKMDERVKKNQKFYMKQEESKMFIKNLHQNYKIQKKSNYIDDQKILDASKQINISLIQLQQNPEQLDTLFPKILQNQKNLKQLQIGKNRYYEKNKYDIL